MVGSRNRHDVPSSMARWIGIDYGGVRTGWLIPTRLGYGISAQNSSDKELMPGIKAPVRPCGGFALGIPTAGGRRAGASRTVQSHLFKKTEQEFPALRHPRR